LDFSTKEYEMSIIEMVKDAEEKAEELKNIARNETEQMLSVSEADARPPGARPRGGATQGGAANIEAAGQLSAQNAELIREGSAQRNAELAETATANKQHTLELILSFL